jgi:hypothetical protein
MLQLTPAGSHMSTGAWREAGLCSGECFCAVKNPATASVCGPARPRDEQQSNDGAHAYGEHGQAGERKTIVVGRYAESR